MGTKKAYSDHIGSQFISSSAIVRVSSVLLSLNWYRFKDPRTPLGTASIVAWARKNLEFTSDASISLFDYDVRENLSNVIQDLITRNPEVLGIGVYCWNVEATLKIINSLRTLGYDGKIVLGGPEITFGDSSLKEEFKNADYFVRGEGEEAFGEILTAVSSGKEPEMIGIFSHNSNDFSTLAVNSEPESMVSPLLDSELCNAVVNDGFTRWQSQRGCKYACSFCAFTLPNKFYRERPVNALKKEFTSLSKLGLKTVAVLDPIFFFNKRRALEIIQYMREYTPETTYEIQTRLENLDREVINALNGMRIVLECGLQTLDPNVQRAIRRVNPRALIERNIEMLQRNRIDFELHLIYGLPFQSAESFHKDLDYTLSTGASRVRIFPLSRLKGTDLDARMFGEYENRLTFSPIFPREVLYTEWMSMQEILAIKRLQEYFESSK